MRIDSLDLSRSESLEHVLDKLYSRLTQVVAELVCHHFDSRSILESVAKAFMAIVGRGRTCSTLNFDDVPFAVQFLDDQFTGINADRLVFSADVTGDFGVHLPIKRDN